jgi:GH18 family chitinase
MVSYEIDGADLDWEYHTAGKLELTRAVPIKLNEVSR